MVTPSCTDANLSFPSLISSKGYRVKGLQAPKERYIIPIVSCYKVRNTQGVNVTSSNRVAKCPASHGAVVHCTTPAKGSGGGAVENTGRLKGIV